MQRIHTKEDITPLKVYLMHGTLLGLMWPLLQLLEAKVKKVLLVFSLKIISNNI